MVTSIFVPHLFSAALNIGEDEPVVAGDVSINSTYYPSQREREDGEIIRRVIKDGYSAAEALWAGLMTKREP